MPQSRKPTPSGGKVPDKTDNKKRKKGGDNNKNNRGSGRGRGGGRDQNRDNNNNNRGSGRGRGRGGGGDQNRDKDDGNRQSENRDKDDGKDDGKDDSKDDQKDQSDKDDSTDTSDESSKHSEYSTSIESYTDDNDNSIDDDDEIIQAKIMKMTDIHDKFDGRNYSGFEGEDVDYYDVLFLDETQFNKWIYNLYKHDKNQQKDKKARSVLMNKILEYEFSEKHRMLKCICKLESYF